MNNIMMPGGSGSLQIKHETRLDVSNIFLINYEYRSIGLLAAENEAFTGKPLPLEAGFNDCRAYQEFTWHTMLENDIAKLYIQDSFVTNVLILFEDCRQVRHQVTTFTVYMKYLHTTPAKLPTLAGCQPAEVLMLFLL